MKQNPFYDGPRPPLFYKFTPFGSWLEQFMRGESLLFSSRSRFNDPFDCRPGYALGSGAEVRKYLHEKFQGKGIPPARRIAIVSELANKFGKTEVFSAHETQSMLDKIGVLCLTTDWSNALMWSHYADHHKGFCVAFRSNIGIFKNAAPLIYDEAFPIIVRPDDDEETLFKKAFLTKSHVWAYENEWRIIKAVRSPEANDSLFRRLCPHMDVADARSFSDQRGAGIYPFKKTAIESITLGMRTSEADEQDIRQAIKLANLDIPIYRVQPPKSTYLLSRLRVA